MVGWRTVVGAFCVAAVLVTGGVILVSGSKAKTLSEAEAEAVLRELPYRFQLHHVAEPEGASGALAGRAFGPHDTVLKFGLSLGRGAAPVSLGPHSDLGNAIGGVTFRVTSDEILVVGGKLKANPRYETRAQWREVASMVAAIEDRLCMATEGDHCPI